MVLIKLLTLKQKESLFDKSFIYLNEAFKQKNY